MGDTPYSQGYRAALQGHSRETAPEEDADQWLDGWDYVASLQEKMNRKFVLKFTLLEDGTQTADIYTMRGKKVAELKQPVVNGEEALALAREFYEANQDLFEEEVTLLDTAAVSEQKNPDLYGDGLETIPES